MLKSTDLNKATLSHLRKYNESLILREIYFYETISRVELARTTKLSRSSVTELTQDLIKRELIVELGPETRSTVGKKPTLLAFNADAYHLIVVTINGTSIVGSLLNLRVQLIQQKEVTIDQIHPEKTLEHVYEVVQTLIDQATRPLLGISIGTPGIIDPDSGVVHLAAIFGWKDLPLGKLMTEHFQLQTCVGNDSKLITIGEYRFGKSKNTQNLIVMVIGDGIGATVLADGRIIHGDSYSAGELGHSSFWELNEMCICGRQGCLETLVSWWGLKQHAQRIVEQYPESTIAGIVHGGEVTTEQLLQALAMHDPHIEALVDRAATYLGQAMTTMIHLINPKQIIFTGSLVQLGDRFLNKVRETITNRAFPFLIQNIEFVVHPDNHESMTSGAGAILLEKELGL
jgi:predicted NBD/HSP70 family sugar kinase